MISIFPKEMKKVWKPGWQPRWMILMLPGLSKK